MRITLLTIFVCAAGVAAEPGAEVGAMFRKRCAACHVVPDKTLATDRAWLDQIRDTTWTAIKPKAREALIGWLKARKLPPRIDTAPTEAKPVAWVEPSFGCGSVVLQRGDRLLRVVWPLGGRDQRRALPPGKYKIRELRMERKKGRATWFISSSGPPYQPLHVSAKGLTKLTIDDGLVCKLTVKPKGKELTIGFNMRAQHGHSITLFKNGKRFVLTYRVLDAKGKQLAQGTMNYGWGGGAGASVKLPDLSKAKRVEIGVDTGPFKMHGPRAVDIG